MKFSNEKSTLLALGLTYIAPVAAQTGPITAFPACSGSPCAASASAVPVCATACIESAASVVGCEHTDYECQCSSSAAIQNGALNCVVAGCGVATGLNVLKSVSSLCACVTASPTTPCASSTAVPSSSVESSEPPVSSGPASSGPASSGPASSGPASSTPASSEPPVSSGPASSGPASSGPASSGPSSSGSLGPSSSCSDEPTSKSHTKSHTKSTTRTRTKTTTYTRSGTTVCETITYTETVPCTTDTPEETGKGGHGGHGGHGNHTTTPTKTGGGGGGGGGGSTKTTPTPTSVVTAGANMKFELGIMGTFAGAVLAAALAL